MKHKSVIKKFNVDKLEEKGCTFLKINWKKRTIHFLSSTMNKKVESVIIPRIIEK